MKSCRASLPGQSGMRRSTLRTELLETVFGLGSTGMAIINANQEFVEVNQALSELLGYSTEELKGHPFADFRNPDAVTGLDSPIGQTWGGKKADFISEEQFITKQRTSVWVRVEVSTADLEAEKGRAGLAIFHDISQEMEMRLKQREDQETLRSLVETLPHGVEFVDPDGTITFANRALHRIYECDEGQLVGRSFFDFVPPKDREKVLAHWKNLVEQRPSCLPFFGEKTTARGNTRFVRVDRGYKWDGGDGQLLGMAKVITDLTEAKKIEDQLHRVRTAFELAVEGSNDGFWDWENLSKDDGWWSPRYYELLGYAHGEIPARCSTFMELLVHPDDRERLLEARRAHLEERVPYRLEYRLRTKSGDYRWFRAHGQALWDDDGRPIRMSGSISDIHERRVAEETCRQVVKQLAISISDMPVAYIRVELEGARVTEWNTAAEQIFGYTKEEIVGERLFENDTVGAGGRLKSLLVATGSVDRIEIEHQLRDGQSIVCEWTSRVLIDKNADDRRFGILLMAQDVTERKLADKQLLHYQKRLQHLVTELSLVEEAERRRLAAELHDGIAPLLALSKIHCRQLLEGEVVNSHDFKLAQQASDLIAQAIDRTRTLTYELSPTILYEFGLEPAIEWLAKVTGDKTHLFCQVKTDERPKPLTQAVSVVLFQSVRELLKNTIRHANANRVQIALSVENGSLVISVLDNGVGFDAGQLHILPSQTGGFGLFSIRERMEALGGQFQIDSGPYYGTRVVLKAPLASETSDQETSGETGIGSHVQRR